MKVPYMAVLSALIFAAFQVYSVEAAPLLAPVVPADMCNTIVIKSVENGRYIGVSQPHGIVSASYGYRDGRSRFVLRYLGGYNQPMVLTTEVSADVSNQRPLALAFEGLRGVTKMCAQADCSDIMQPRYNASLRFGRWPTTNVTFGGASVGAVVGPFLRLYLVNLDNEKYEPRAVVGVNESGEVVLYTLDAAATTADIPTVNPSTLFVIDIISAGARGCKKQ